MVCLTQADVERITGGSDTAMYKQTVVNMINDQTTDPGVLNDFYSDYSTKSVIRDVLVVDGVINIPRFADVSGIDEGAPGFVDELYNLYGDDPGKIDHTIETLMTDPEANAEVLAQFAGNFKSASMVADALTMSDGSIDIKTFAIINKMELKDPGAVDKMVLLFDGNENAIQITTEQLTEDPETDSAVLNQLFVNKDTKFVARSTLVKDADDVEGWQNALQLRADGELSDDAWDFIVSEYSQYSSLYEPFSVDRLYDPVTDVLDAEYGARYLKAGYPMIDDWLAELYEEDPQKVAAAIDLMARAGDFTDWSVPNRYADLYDTYRGVPSNFVTRVDIAGRKVTWTDGLGKSHSMYVFESGRVLGPNGQYHDGVETILINDGTYEYTHKLNRDLYTRFLAGEYGDPTLPGAWETFCATQNPYGEPTYKQKLPSSYSGGGGGGGGGGSSIGSRSYVSGNPGLFIDSGGLEAEVIIQGMVVGRTDTGIIPLPAGEYTITVAKAGYHTRTTVILVYATKTTSVRMVLYEKDPDICMFVDDVGGVEHVTTEHCLYVYFKYKRWHEAADRMGQKCDPPIGTFPSSVTLNDALFVYYLAIGDYVAAYDMTAAGTVCPTSGGEPE